MAFTFVKHKLRKLIMILAEFTIVTVCFFLCMLQRSFDAAFFVNVAHTFQYAGSQSKSSSNECTSYSCFSYSSNYGYCAG
jgi:hypothetical protein